MCEWYADNPTTIDWQCYLNRYWDLRAAFGDTNTIAAESHYATNGASEGRDNTCG